MSNTTYTTYTNYLQMLPDDVMSTILDMVSDDATHQIQRIEKQVSKLSLYKVVREKDWFPQHYILDGFFHINPDINLDRVIPGPITLDCPNVMDPLFIAPDILVDFPNGDFGIPYVDIKPKNDISIRNLLIEVIKYMGRRPISYWQRGFGYNCITKVSIDEDYGTNYDLDLDSYEDEEGSVRLGKLTEVVIEFDDNINHVSFKVPRVKDSGIMRIR
jgi:hypothetical protein